MNIRKAKKVALITGSSKGLRLGIARQLGNQGITVLIAARNEEQGNKVSSQLNAEGIDAHFLKLDVTDPATISEAYKAIAAQFGKLDILVNNAGVNFEFSAGLPAPSKVELDILKKTFDVNFFGAVAVTQAMLPLIHKSDTGRIVNVSSNLASLALHQDPNFQLYDVKQLAYDSSKTALNVFTVHL